MIYFLSKNVPDQSCAVPVHLSEMVDFYWFETKKVPDPQHIRNISF
jgi:hypothetical protein